MEKYCIKYYIIQEAPVLFVLKLTWDSLTVGARGRLDLQWVPEVGFLVLLANMLPSTSVTETKTLAVTVCRTFIEN